MQPIDHFRHCPRCATPLPPREKPNAIHCKACDWVYFFNPTVAVGSLVRNTAGELLFLRRAANPAKGKLGVPGGFIDMNETAEAALHREVKEETGLELDDVEFIGSWPNQYLYRDVTYPVLDLYFAARAKAGPITADASEVTSTCWLDPHSLTPEDIAFPSLGKALDVWRGRIAK